MAVQDDIGAPPAAIEHIFVLMLENRSFDHMLGWSGIHGTDASTGLPTAIDGLTGEETNPLANGTTIPVSRGARYALTVDPRHEFADVLEQLGGAGAGYPKGGPYPAAVNSGFASRFAGTFPADLAANGCAPMTAFTPDQVPVITQLAREFAVCDRWFSSLPGPTWPNRFFAHAASSGGLDDSPQAGRSLTDIAFGFKFANGTIYERLDQVGKGWFVVEGDAFPQALVLHGMLERVPGRFISFDALKSRLGQPGYGAALTFIEPDYGHVVGDGRNFMCGNSQHPLDDVTRGEAFIKEVYGCLRASQYWGTSLLLITYDEHGGFYDHVPPPSAVPPGDAWVDSTANVNGFGFDRLGVRVPAVVVSPLVPRGLVDHTQYDHSSISAAVRTIFGTTPLTARDAAANSFTHLASLSEPRTDTPMVLETPAASGIPDCESFDIAGDLLSATQELNTPAEKTLIGFLEVAMLRSLQMSMVELGSTLERTIDHRGAELEAVIQRAATKFDIAGALRDVEKAYHAFRQG
jgi:phospholipase C